jgi:hypothetical protein
MTGNLTSDRSTEGIGLGFTKMYFSFTVQHSCCVGLELVTGARDWKSKRSSRQRLLKMLVGFIVHAYELMLLLLLHLLSSMYLLPEDFFAQFSARCI